MSIAARAISSRATSSTSLAGIRGTPLGPAEGERDELREALLELGGHGGADLTGRAGALAAGGGPVLEIGLLVVRPRLHGQGIDEGLEPLRQRERDLVGVVLRLDGGGNVPPLDDAVRGHHPPMNCASSAMR